MTNGFGESDMAQVQSDRAASEGASRRAQGGYGICEDCGKKISAERLSFLPEATRCVSCQARQEQT